MLDKRKETQRRLELILSVNTRYRKNSEADTKKLQAYLEQLDADIATARHATDVTDETQVPELVQAVMKRLQDSAEVLSLGTNRERMRLAWLLLRGVDFNGMTGVVTFRFRVPALFVLNPDLMEKLFWSAVTARKSNTGNAKQSSDLFLGDFRYQLSPGKGKHPSTIAYIGVEDPGSRPRKITA